MTGDHFWFQSHSGDIHWLRQSKGALADGLLEQRPESWHVAAWLPSEREIATLPRDMPLDEALATAKMLILLSLKE